MCFDPVVTEQPQSDPDANPDSTHKQHHDILKTSQLTQQVTKSLDLSDYYYLSDYQSSQVNSGY